MCLYAGLPPRRRHQDSHPIASFPQLGLTVPDGPRPSLGRSASSPSRSAVHAGVPGFRPLLSFLRAVISCLASGLGSPMLGPPFTSPTYGTLVGRRSGEVTPMGPEGFEPPKRWFGASVIWPLSTAPDGRGRDSNPQPSTCKADALPLSYRPASSDAGCQPGMVRISPDTTPPGRQRIGWDSNPRSVIPALPMGIPG